MSIIPAITRLSECSLTRIPPFGPAGLRMAGELYRVVTFGCMKRGPRCVGCVWRHTRGPRCGGYLYLRACGLRCRAAGVGTPTARVISGGPILQSGGLEQRSTGTSLEISGTVSICPSSSGLSKFLPLSLQTPDLRLLPLPPMKRFLSSPGMDYIPLTSSGIWPARHRRGPWRGGLPASVCPLQY